jgi:NAD(P)-dependent dehydrogenase (short-subunit alcohol dehydrogenase family)
VTGAGTTAHGANSIGIGRAITLALAREGASVLIVDKVESNAQDTRRGVEDEGLTASSVFVGDVTSEVDCAAMVTAAVERYGGVDILVNNAAITRHVPIVDTAEALYDEVVGINLGGAFKASKYAIPALIARGGGSIVNIGSVAGIRDTGSSHPAYSASKAGLLGLMVDLAGEYGRHNIRVNSVLPGMVRSPMQESVRQIPADEQAQMNMLGRMGDGWDIANAVMWLCSAEASYITGVTLPVDGGATNAMIVSRHHFTR